MTTATPRPLSVYAKKLHYFDDGITVETERQPNGQYTAIDADNYEPGFPFGWGVTWFSAIADLAEQMRERGWPAEEIEAEQVDEIERRAA